MSYGGCLTKLSTLTLGESAILWNVQYMYLQLKRSHCELPMITQSLGGANLVC